MTIISPTFIRPNSAAAPSSLRNEDPRALAQAILNETSGKSATYDRLGQIEARLDAIARTDPEFAAQVRKEIMASNRLSFTDKAILTRNEPGRTVDLDGRVTNRSIEGGMALDPWINTVRRADTPEYRALVKLAGSSSNEAIKLVLSELDRRDMNPDQLATARLNEASAASNELIADLGQMGLDIVGIFDPTPTADLVNAGISAWRGDGWGAFLSTLSAVPYVGDLAKLGKLGKWAETTVKAVDAAANNPAVRAILEPSLRKISDLIGALPAKAFNALPESAKSELLAIKAKIDGLLSRSATEVRPSIVDGRSQHYFDDAGVKGAWNKKLNQKLEANADYHINGYKFSTDNLGRVSSVEGRLTLAKAARLKSQ